jgi:hypothetical protein
LDPGLAEGISQRRKGICHFPSSICHLPTLKSQCIEWVKGKWKMAIGKFPFLLPRKGPLVWGDVPERA